MYKKMIPITMNTLHRKSFHFVTDWENKVSGFIPSRIRRSVPDIIRFSCHHRNTRMTETREKECKYQRTLYTLLPHTHPREWQTKVGGWADWLICGELKYQSWSVHRVANTTGEPVTFSFSILSTFEATRWTAHDLEADYSRSRIALDSFTGSKDYLFKRTL